MAREIYRADDRGVVHATNEWTSTEYASDLVPTPALCAQFVDKRLIMCRGPRMPFPNCLHCIVRGTIREGRE